MTENRKSKIKFSYTNLFKYSTSMKENFDANVFETSEFEYIVDRFKAFLVLAQFSEELVNKIQIIDNNGVLEFKKSLYKKLGFSDEEIEKLLERDSE